MHYTQLSHDQRVEIKAYLKIGLSYAKIADHLGVHRSTVCRDIHRNQSQRGYRPKQAHELALSRRTNALKRKRFTEEVQK